MKTKFVTYFVFALVIIFTSFLMVTAEAAKKSSKNTKMNKAAPSSISATGGKVFIFDPRRLLWAVYDSNGKLVRSGHAVGGKRHCADVHRPCMTPVGTFRIYSKAGPHFRSSKYPLPHGGASMPWAMFFRGGFAIHGSNELPNRPASHGCIRVAPGTAQWLNHYLPIGTKVIVKPY